MNIWFDFNDMKLAGTFFVWELDVYDSKWDTHLPIQSLDVQANI